MTSERKIKANRANARASSGPKTALARARAARNALRHGLNLPIYSNPALSEEVEARSHAKLSGRTAVPKSGNSRAASRKRRSIYAGCVMHVISSSPKH